MPSYSPWGDKPKIQHVTSLTKRLRGCAELGRKSLTTGGRDWRASQLWAGNQCERALRNWA